MPGNSYISCTCFEQCDIDWLDGVQEVSEKCKPMNSFLKICKTIVLFWSVREGMLPNEFLLCCFGGRFKKWSTCSSKHSVCFSETPSFFPHDTCSVPAGYERERKLNQVIMLTKTLRRGLYWNWGPVLALPHMGPYSSKAHGFQDLPYLVLCNISCKMLDFRHQRW